MNEQIINNYHKICDNMMEYIIENTAADYSLGDLQFRGRLKFDMIRFLHKIITNLPILTAEAHSSLQKGKALVAGQRRKKKKLEDDDEATEAEESLAMFGGSRITYLLSEDEHNVESFKQKKFLPNNIYDIDSSKKNIVIIGGSINGLYMSILLKLFIPNLNVIIVTEKTHSEMLIREQLIRESLRKSSSKLLESDKLTLERLIFNCSSEARIGEFIGSEPANDAGPEEDDDEETEAEGEGARGRAGHFFSLLPNHIKACFSLFGANVNAIEINIIEYCFANYTQQLGNYIIFIDKQENIARYISEETIMVFDATGGRLEPIMSYDWTDAENKYDDRYHRKGYNKTPITMFRGKLCVAIGDSLYQGNFGEGNSVVISFCICFILSLVLSKILPKEEEEKLLGGKVKLQHKKSIKKKPIKKRQKSRKTKRPKCNS
uniref:Uncharacterized protein n=1 Tax=viral metagenome TaxID=1070528 RepID=A0A6C0I3J7_9ZZZZ